MTGAPRQRNLEPACDPVGYIRHLAEDLRRQHRHDCAVKRASFQGSVKFTVAVQDEWFVGPLSDCLNGSIIKQRMTTHNADFLHPSFNRNLNLKHNSALNSGGIRKCGISRRWG